MLSTRSAARLLIERGPRALARRAAERLLGRDSPRHQGEEGLTALVWRKRYLAWLAEDAVTPHARTQMQNALASLPLRSTVSVLMPVHNPPLSFLRSAVESVRAQLYDRWELCIADDGSRAEVGRELDRLARTDDRIVVIRSEENRGISAATNLALASARGEYVGFLDHDDVLHEAALYCVARAIAEDPLLDVLYTDRDAIDEQGEHQDPFFKPDWSPLGLLSHNYAVHFLVVRRALLEELGGLRPEFDGAQDYDLLLRLSERTDSVAHIPRILYSWRRHSGSNAGRPRPAAFEAGRRAIADALRRRGLAGEVETVGESGPYRTRLALTTRPLVSLVISSRSRTLLDQCTRSIAAKTTYDNLEVLVATNAVGDAGLNDLCRERRFRLVEVQDGFFSRMNNAAAQAASGDYLLFLNDDIEVMTPSWIEEMLSLAKLPRVAAVGPKMVYPGGRIQFTRVVMGVRRDGRPYFFDPFDQFDTTFLYGFSVDVATEVSSVSGGCMVTPRDLFLGSGGFEEEEFGFSYQDVDWSIRIRQRGYTILYSPHAVITHYGSLSKKGIPEMMSREVSLANAFFRKNAAWLRRGDRFFNPNLLDVHGLVAAPCFPGLEPVPVVLQPTPVDETLEVLSPGDAREALDRLAERLVKVLGGRRFIHLGCGRGELVAALLRAGAEALGVREIMPIGDTVEGMSDHVLAGSIADEGDVVRLSDLGPFDVAVCTGVLERIPIHALPRALACLRALAATVVLVTRRPDFWERDRPDTLVNGSREFWLGVLRDAGLEEARRDARAIFTGTSGEGIERLVARGKG